MKNLIILFFSLLVSISGNSQPPLEFIEIGYEPAYCRLFDYQVGNGQVYAAAAGGTPDYTYQWRNLTTGDTAPVTTWGGLNPACYEITVTDALGWELIDTVCIDSLNPVALINVVSSTLTPTTDGFIGIGGQYVTLQNQSLYYCNPWNPICDSSCWWDTDKGYGWQLHQNEQFLEDKVPWYGPGEYDIRLKVQNKNGCSDTAWVKIGIFGPAVLGENGESGYFLYSNYESQLLTFQKLGYEEGICLKIFDVAGKLIKTEAARDQKSEFEFYEKHGTYIYTVSNLSTGKELERGKFVH